MIGGFLPLLLSSCTTLVAKHQFKWPIEYKLCLLTNGELKTIPKKAKKIVGYEKWEIDDEGFIDIIKLIKTSSKSEEKKEFRSHLYSLIIQDKNIVVSTSRECFVKVRSPSVFPIEIRKLNDKIIYTDLNLTLSQLKIKLPEMNKNHVSLRIMPASNIRMNDIYPLLTVLNNLGHKRAFVQIYRKDGQEIKSKCFQIDFENWSKSIEGTFWLKNGKDFFKDLK